MGRLSDRVMHEILNAYFGNGTTSIPASYYVALSSTAPTNTGGNVTEPSGGGYARVQVPNDSTAWNTAANRATSNKIQILFPTATADWGNMTHFVLWNTVSGVATGSFVGWGELAAPVAVASGGTADFPAGTLVITAPGS